MLYISRRAVLGNELAYGVVDTDDDVETIVNTDGIEEAHRHGLTIRGVATHWVSGDDINPYQPEGTFSPLQVKTRVMKKVSVGLYGSMITSVEWLFGVDNPRIRLSDFGDSVADLVIYGNVLSVTPVTLVLDDKLKSITKYSFRIETCSSLHDTQVQMISRANGWKRLRVLFDVSELTNQEILDTFYEQLFWYNQALAVTIDSEERKLAMRRKFLGM